MSKPPWSKTLYIEKSKNKAIRSRTSALPSVTKFANTGSNDKKDKDLRHDNNQKVSDTLPGINLQQISLTTQSLHVPSRAPPPKPLPVAKLKPIKVIQSVPKPPAVNPPPAPPPPPPPPPLVLVPSLPAESQSPSPEKIERTAKGGETYWQDLAEQRRAALVDAQAENEKLLKRVSELTTKNQELELIVDQAKYFASMLHFVIGVGRDSRAGNNTNVQQSVDRSSTSASVRSSFLVASPNSPASTVTTMGTKGNNHMTTNRSSYGDK